MKLEELMIGNLFIEENSGQIIEVIGLEKNRVIFSGMFLDKWQAKPIPITGEWLLKLGFGKLKNSNEWYFIKINEFELLIHLSGYKVCFGNRNVFLKGDFKHIHKLQNLYFALTNKKLTL